MELYATTPSIIHVYSSRMRVRPLFPLPPTLIPLARASSAVRLCECCLKERRSLGRSTLSRTRRGLRSLPACTVHIDWHYEADQSTLPRRVEGSKRARKEISTLPPRIPRPLSLRGCRDTLSLSQASRSPPLTRPPRPANDGDPRADRRRGRVRKSRLQLAHLSLSRSLSLSLSLSLSMYIYIYIYISNNPLRLIGNL